MISFHTVLTVVGGKRIPDKVVIVTVVGGWALTALLSMSYSPLLFIELIICSAHWPPCDREGRGRTILWYRRGMVFRNIEIWSSENLRALLTSTFYASSRSDLQTLTMLP